MSRLQIPIRLIALFLTILAGCQQDFTAEVTILGIGPTIEKLEVYIWRDRRRSNEAPQDIKPEQASFKIRVPINEFTKRIELAVLGMEADSELKSHGYAQFDLEAGTDSSTISVELVDARRSQPADEYACPDPIESGIAECDSPLIHTAEDGAYWELRSHTLSRTLDTKRWNVWEDHTDNSLSLRALDSLGANYAVAAGDNGTLIECIGNQCSHLSSPTNKVLRSVRARSADDRVLRAVGEKGTIVNCAKGGCTLMDSKTKENLHGTMFSSVGVLRAVGDRGTLLRCEDTQCFSFHVGFDVTLRAIFGNDPSLYWIVGDVGLVLKCSDDNKIPSCKKIDTPTENNLADVWGSDIDTAVVVGDKGTLLTCMESGCTAVPDIGTTRDLKHIHGSDPDNIIVSGADKTTILSNGREWRKVERKPPPPVLTAIAVSTGHLNPVFSPTTEAYTLAVPKWTGSIQLTATSPNATIQLNGTDIPSGVTSGPIPLGTGVTMISVAVRAPGTTDRVYGIAVIRSGSDYLKASNTDRNAAFGSSMSSSGDTLAVGAPYESSDATGVDGDQANKDAVGSGAVYVFVRSGGVWTQQAYLKASNTRASDSFGYSVSLSGDTLAVGALFEGSNAKGVNGDQSNNFAPNSGAVYVFVRSGGVWTQQAYLKASNTDLPDFFGTTVALSGDTLAVGAMEEDSSARGVNGDQSNNSAFASGAVYVFVRSGGVWTQQAYLKASNTDAGDFFGVSVALSGDTLAVGAFGEDSTAKGVNGNQAGRHSSTANSGAVYVFVRSGGVWTQQAYLKASNTDAGDWFGARVALSGDTLAVGAYGEGSTAKGVNGNQAERHSSTANSGAVYVFVRSGGVWTQQAYIKASNTDAGDYFGDSVSLSGDTLAVGAPGEDSIAKGVNGDQANKDAVGSGAVYVFVRSGGNWTQQAYLKASNTDAGDRFGVSVALSGDTIAIGACGEDSTAKGVNGNQAERHVSTANSGAVYVF